MSGPGHGFHLGAAGGGAPRHSRPPAVVEPGSWGESMAAAAATPPSADLRCVPERMVVLAVAVVPVVPFVVVLVAVVPVLALALVAAVERWLMPMVPGRRHHRGGGERRRRRRPRRHLAPGRLSGRKVSAAGRRLIHRVVVFLAAAVVAGGGDGSAAAPAAGCAMGQTVVARGCRVPIFVGTRRRVAVPVKGCWRGRRIIPPCSGGRCSRPVPV